MEAGVARLMTIRPLQFLTGVLVGVLVGGAAVYQVGHEPIQRFISDAIATFDGLAGRDARPAVPASEKEQQRQADEQAKAKTLRDRQAQQLRVDQQKAGDGSAATIRRRGSGPVARPRVGLQLATPPGLEGGHGRGGHV